MKKLLQLLFVLSISSPVFSQGIGVFGGGIYGTPFEVLDSGVGVGTAQATLSESFGLSWENRYKGSSCGYSFAIYYDLIQTNYDLTDVSPGGGTRMNMAIKKRLISLSYYPINLSMGKFAQVSFGPEVNYLIQDLTTGELTKWQKEGPPTISALSTDDLAINRKVQVGVNLGLSFRIKLTENILFVPQTQLYLGFAEFKDIDRKPLTFRQRIGLGLVYNY